MTSLLGYLAVPYNADEGAAASELDEDDAGAANELFSSPAIFRKEPSRLGGESAELDDETTSGSSSMPSMPRSISIERSTGTGSALTSGSSLSEASLAGR